MLKLQPLFQRERESDRASPSGVASLPQLGKDLRDLLLAVDHLGQEADAIDLAFVVPARLDQDVGLVLRRDGEAVEGFCEPLAIELLELLLGVLRGLAFALLSSAQRAQRRAGLFAARNRTLRVQFHHIRRACSDPRGGGPLIRPVP